MSEIELPKLPPSQMNVDVWDSEVRGLHSANAAYYTADQLREYAYQAVLAERERCAKACEEVNATTGECPELALYCAAAIRNGGEWGTSSVSSPEYQQEQRDKNARMRNLVDSIVPKG